MPQNNNVNSSFNYIANQLKNKILTTSYEKKTFHIGSPFLKKFYQPLQHENEN